MLKTHHFLTYGTDSDITRFSLSYTLGRQMKRRNRHNTRLPLTEIFEVASRLFKDRKKLTLYRQQLSREL